MIKKVLYGILNAISLLAIVAAVGALLCVVMTPAGQAPNIMGYTALRVLTGSMEPAIPIDSLIVVQRVDASAIEVGDIISFYSADPSLDGAVNTHRVVAVEQGSTGYVFTTQGDANSIADKYPAYEKALLGRVVYGSVLLGLIVAFLTTPVAFVALILVPLAGMVIYNLYKVIHSARQAMKDEEEEAVRKAVEELRRRRAESAVKNGENDEKAPQESLTDKP